MITKEEIQIWVKEEWDRLEKEKQNKCNHRRSGTFHQGISIVVCDDCNKELTEEDVVPDKRLDKSAQLIVDSVRMKL